MSLVLTFCILCFFIFFCRRPGSAGRTRTTTDTKTSGATATKKVARPTTAPGRRREDQAVAHGMSDQMVDAASEEVRLRALMNDVNWDGRGRSDMYVFFLFHKLCLCTEKC